MRRATRRCGSRRPARRARGSPPGRARGPSTDATPFARVDGPLAALDAIELSVPVVRHMLGELQGALPDFVVWGSVVPNLTYSNIAREVLMDAGAPATIPAFSTVMACSTSMVAAI